ncbi:TetR/AcrR family transcriptional regulator [Spirochaeta isovalerica]|uniref:AcrR family transcriptional regulator n=1 Tax=Spirochaeta isovalerica TaxID=150 RepID=A0A841R9R9_9SPIO|nr:TetR/AcrR family transcriptional regulator [Spirochaeta isovalerica]MBB6479202.1 AcrR family transcriptional regulator [Spirochaeta isovalerica]
MARSRDDNKRKAVMDSAVFLFSSKGYAATSIQDIVAHSGLSVGTVYNYFANKEELLTSLIEEGWAEFFEEIKEGIKSRQGKGSFEYFYNILFDTVLENIDLASLLINEPLLYPKLEKIAGDIFGILQDNPEILPENINRMMGYQYDKSIFYASALGTIQAIKLAKRGYIDIDADSLKMSIGRIFIEKKPSE